MTQSLSPKQLEQIAHNLCSLHDFDPAFVAGQEKFARAVITEFQRAAPAPDPDTLSEAVGLLREALLRARWYVADHMDAQPNDETGADLAAVDAALGGVK